MTYRPAEVAKVVKDSIGDLRWECAVAIHASSQCGSGHVNHGTHIYQSIHLYKDEPKITTWLQVVLLFTSHL